MMPMQPNPMLGNMARAAVLRGGPMPPPPPVQGGYMQGPQMAMPRQGMPGPTPFPSPRPTVGY